MKNVIASKLRLGAMITAVAALPLGTAWADTANAETEATAGQTASQRIMDTVTTQASKKSDVEDVQDVAVAVTAYGESQLDALKVRDIQDLSFSMPNVSFADIGTARGTANFSIRGLGINSSIPSIDPSVGVFVDGVYLGINAGVVFDIFDLESVEVLRGPQGLLFGRNVTGGAVLLTTAKPTNEVEIKAKAAVETGLNYFVMASMGGAVIEDKLFAKLSVYYNQDDGYFRNQFNNRSHGQAETFMVRPSIVWRPTDNLEFQLSWEHGESDGDGPFPQSRVTGRGASADVAFANLAGLLGEDVPMVFDRNTLDAAFDFDGSYDNEWNHVVFRTDWDIEFGDGTITNIFGYRDYSAATSGDIDGTTLFIFNSDAGTDQEQWSNELRYAGRFMDRLDVTIGAFYFTQDLVYQENRFIRDTNPDNATFLSIIPFFGGGLQEHDTWAIFSNFDFEVTDNLILTAGIRYAEEEKDVVISRIVPGAECSVAAGTCSLDFEGSDKWTNVTPKVGLQYLIDDTKQVYAHWTRGFRSGGFNLRDTASQLGPEFAPGPFDEESVDAYEIGFKGEFLESRLRTNLAIFFMQIDDMQREVNIPDPVSGVRQLIRNTADADIFGFELEAQFLVTDQLLLTASVGHTDGDYTDVLFDLNADGVVDEVDQALSIPRLAPWTYSFGFVFDQPVGNFGDLSLRANFSHRDQVAYTDDNFGFINAADMLDVSLTLTTFNSSTDIAFYGKNLLNEVTAGGDTQLSFGSFSPLNKGRILGVEVNFRY